MTAWLHPKLAAFAPALIIFDKDGTLIDFHAMWGAWAVELAQCLETTVDLPVAPLLFKALGFDPVGGRIAPHGHLALTPAAGLKALVADLLQAAGVSRQKAEAALTACWQVPDPVALARPVTDLKVLFAAIRSQGAKIAVATSDDRPSTEATLVGLGVRPLVDALACADDGRPIKPDPDMAWRICRRLDVPPARTVVVGDNVVDLQMGRAAGAGLIIGVLSGVGVPSELAVYADIVLPSIASLLESR